jgi:hypothetical protein
MMTRISYRGYRFPPEIIQHAIWLYVQFTLSFRDIEDLLAERGIVVSHETVRRWVGSVTFTGFTAYYWPPITGPVLMKSTTQRFSVRPKNRLCLLNVTMPG